jgi:hypothetical protein
MNKDYVAGWNDCLKAVQKHLIDHANYSETYPEDLEYMRKKLSKETIAAIFSEVGKVLPDSLTAKS